MEEIRTWQSWTIVIHWPKGLTPVLLKDWWIDAPRHYCQQPDHYYNFKWCILKGTLSSQLRKRQTETADYYSWDARSISALSDGDVVRMKPFRLGDKEWRKATVTSRLVERSYTVESPEGDTYRRNRVHLKKTQETPSEPTDNSDTNEHGGAQKKRIYHPHLVLQNPQEKQAEPVKIRRNPVLQGTWPHLKSRDHNEPGDLPTRL